MRLFPSAAAAATLLAVGLLSSTASRAEGARTGHYVVEPGHTQVVFGVSHFGFTTFYGWFSGTSGTLDLAASPADDKLSITIPVGSVKTTSDKLDGELTEWFGAAQFPQATFTSTSVTPTGATTADVTGDFTFHGVTHPLTLHAHFMRAGVNPIDKAYTVGFSATGTLKRSLWGVSKYVPAVGDDVALTLSGAFEYKG